MIDLPPADVQCVAEAIYFEARGEGDNGMRAVSHVIHNRIKSSRFPNSGCGVVHQKGQFTYNKKARPKNNWAWQKSLKYAKEPGYDLTNGAINFHNRTVNPRWKMRVTYRWKNHIFYK